MKRVVLLFQLIQIFLNVFLVDEFDFPADASRDELQKAAPDLEEIQKWLEGKTIRKVIVVPGRMINIVVG